MRAIYRNALAADFAREEPLRPEHEDDNNGEERHDLAHGPLKEELGHRLRLGDAEGGNNRSEKTRGTSEDHDEKGVHDVKRSGGGSGGSYGGEYRTKSETGFIGRWLSPCRVKVTAGFD